MPNANPVAIEKTYSRKKKKIRNGPRSQVTGLSLKVAYSALAAMVSTKPITTAATATISVPTNLAARKRVREGSRVNVTIAVRWLHSLVTDITPRTGSRMFMGMLAPAAKSSNVTVWSWASTTQSWMISTRAVNAAMEISSHRPARVSNILRSSTDTSRLNGTLAVWLTSRVIGALVAVLMKGLLRSLRSAPGRWGPRAGCRR